MTVICVLPEGGSINVQFADGGRTFRSGDAVDLDQVIVPATKDRPAETWRDALGAHLSAFAEQAEPKDLWADDGQTQE
jgi:hypothetical protein